METSNSTGGKVQGTSINSTRRKYNFIKGRKKKKKMKTMMEITRNAEKGIKLK